jgi:hypothetical protein
MRSPLNEVGPSAYAVEGRIQGYYNVYEYTEVPDISLLIEHIAEPYEDLELGIVIKLVRFDNSSDSEMKLLEVIERKRIDKV